MRKIYLLITLFICNEAISQTGPGGVGSATNNLIWLDANNLSQINGSFVKNWTDKSGNGSNALQNNAGLKPVFRTNEANGFPAIDFDGSNDFLKSGSIGGFSNDGTVSYIFVIRPDNLTQASAPFTNSYTGSSNQNRLHGLIYTTAGTMFSFIRTAASLLKGDMNNSLSYSIQTMVATGTDLSSFTNSSAAGFQAGVPLVPSNHGYFQLGSRPFLNDAYFDGKLAEVIGFDDNLTGTQRILIDNYLSSKYAIAIAGANDHYALEGSGHYFNVSGIGMEGGNSVTDAEGRSLVQVNTASTLANGDYLLWGHNNATLTANTVDVPAEFAGFAGSRLNRTWRMDETNDVGTYTLAINMSTAAALGPDVNDYALMIDDDGDFTNGGTTYHTAGFTYVANVATWTGVKIPDGSYFTVCYLPYIYSITTGPWNDPNTWNCTCVPTSADDASVSPAHVVTVDAASSINNLNISATGTLDFSTGMELEITGDLVSLGTLTGTDGIVTFNGIIPQFIDVASATFDVINIDNSNDVTVNAGTISITGVLTVVSGNFEVGTDLVTLTSDINTTARIGQSSGTISGAMIIQRFVDARPEGYSDMSSPVQSATFADWDAELEMGFGVYVPDVTEPSAYGYDESIWDYYGIETSAEIITPGVGYEVYLDTDADSLTSFPSMTLDLHGTPNMGDIPVAVTVVNDGWNLIGNPYASFIDWTTFRTNAGVAMNSQFLYYDEAIEDFNTGNLGDVIAQSEGFWIEATAGGNATFHENNKTTDNNSSYRMSNELLFGLNVSSSLVKYASNTYFRLNESATLAYENDHDLSFLKVPNKKAPSLYSISSEGKKLRINELAPEESMIIPVNFKAAFDGIYSITAKNIETANIDGYDLIILEDTKNGIFFDLSTGDYDFESTDSDSEERFILHLRKSETTVELVEDGITFVNSNEGVFVNFNLELANTAFIGVYNVAGQIISPSTSANVENNRVLVTIPDNFHGAYFIRVIIGDKMVTQQYFKN